MAKSSPRPRSAPSSRKAERVPRIDSSARVADSARIGADVEIGPYCIIGPDVEIGEGTRLHAHVFITGHTKIGPRNEIHPFASLGTPPQSVQYRGGSTRLVIGAENIIREHVTMNTGTEDGRGETRVGDKCFIMTAAHVGHDCIVGNEVTLVNGVLLAGHCQVGDFAVLSGAAALHQFVRVGPMAFIGGNTGVVKDLLPYCATFGMPGEFRGLNLVGLRRRGLTRAEITTLRAALRVLFEATGPMRERADRLAAAFPADKNVARIVDFICAGDKRPFLLPERKSAETAGGEGDV